VIARTLIDHPDRLREKVGRIFDAGVDQIQLHVAWGLTGAEAMQSMELFSETVMGEFAPAHAA
jgi:predicted DNA-binding WGR domain protein